MCAQLAARLGAAHVALPALLRGQLAALQKTGSQLPPAESAESSLAESLRTGKLVSATSTLRAVQTALHAAPEGLILVEHSRVDNPLESLVATIRPSLVLLIRPPATPPSPREGSNWADSLRDVEARQAYEIRLLDSLGDDAPQVRMCSGDCDEACELIFDFLCNVSAAAHPECRFRDVVAWHPYLTDRAACCWQDVEPAYAFGDYSDGDESEEYDDDYVRLCKEPMSAVQGVQ